MYTYEHPAFFFLAEMAEGMTLRLSAQQAALLGPLLRQFCVTGDSEMLTPPRSEFDATLCGSNSGRSSFSSTLSSSGGSTSAVEEGCRFTLEELLSRKEKGTKGSEAQKFLNVSYEIQSTSEYVVTPVLRRPTFVIIYVVSYDRTCHDVSYLKLSLAGPIKIIVMSYPSLVPRPSYEKIERVWSKGSH